MLLKCSLVILALVVFAPIYCQANRMYAGVSVNFSGQVYPVFSFTVDHSTPDNVNRFRAGEVHHLYLGAGLLLFRNKWCRAVGLVLVADDLTQHLLRVNTPIHMLSDQLGRSPWYQQLCEKVNF